MINVYNNLLKDIKIVNENINKNQYLITLTDIILDIDYILNTFTLKLEIKDNKLIIHKKLNENAGAFQRRGENVILLIQNTLKLYKISNCIFYIYIGDDFINKYIHLPIFIIAKPENKLGCVLFPDQTYIDIEPENMTDKLKKQNINKEPIDINTINIRNNENIKTNELFFVGQNINLQDTNFNIRKYFSNFKKPFKVLIDHEFIPLKDFSKYKYLLNLPGAYPWSFRFKFLFLMNSLIININLYDNRYKTDKKWINVLDPLFEKNKDYIEIDYYFDKNINQINNINILKNQILNIYKKYENNEKEYNKIVKSGYNKSKYITLETSYKIIYYILNKINIKNNNLINFKKYNKYKKYINLENKLGNGVYGQVYNLNKLYIIKMVNNIIGEKSAYNELYIYSKINENEKIKKLFLELKDAFTYEKKTYFIIEKADIALNKMNYEEINWDNLYKDILICLNNLHSIGVIHNDLSPENIMYSYNTNKYYIIDFGNSFYKKYFNNNEKDIDYKLFKQLPSKYKNNFIKEKEKLSLEDLKKYFTNKDIEYYDYFKQFLPNKIEFEKFLYSKLSFKYIEINKLYINDYENKLFSKINKNLI